MSKKGFLITVFVISLLLIGLMLIVADVRMNSFFEDTNTEKKQTQPVLENNKQKQSELTPEEYPESLQQFNTKAEELLAYIALLKEDFVVGDSFEEMDARKNEILFDKNTNLYSAKGQAFIEKIEAYEKSLAVVHREFPKTKSIIASLRATKRGEDWLIENFKDFPVISVNASLNNMESTIRRKRKDVTMLVITKN
ncbi:hypothetical protein [Kordia jejudonensis]|uniref:hypothetical protein n=1 Tax=Kordia jejudonensis TaxID=1348245 RepID=UPI0006294AAC|nr:hypothetical protein [Kordia jejudonensis]